MSNPDVCTECGLSESVHSHGEDGYGMHSFTMRANESAARAAIDTLLEQQLGEVPPYDLDADGERCWSFWVLEEDTTSYVHPDLRIEWYGTEWRRHWANSLGFWFGLEGRAWMALQQAGISSPSEELLRTARQTTYDTVDRWCRL